MKKNDRLFRLLRQLDHEDLLFLLRNGLGNTEIKFNRYSHEALTDQISLELRKAAGHSFANFFRLDHEFPYKQILIDVAKRMSKGHKSTLYKFSDSHSEEEIEKEILRLFELRTQRWWKKLKDSERQKLGDEIVRVINAKLVNRINRMDYIKHRIKKEIKDSVITKGIVAGMLAVSAGGYLGVLGGSLLTSVGRRMILNTVGPKTGIAIMGGIAEMSGISVATLIGATTVGLGVFVPSTIYFYADTDYKKTIPAIIMLLSKVHLNKALAQQMDNPV
jgi:uncharacterized protein YaaW (UPF0174 family)